MYSIVETTKGKQCLLLFGFRYLCDRVRNENTYWRCELRSSCPGRASQKGGGVPTVTSPHNHEPNEERNEAEQFKTTLKRRIRDELTPVRKVFRSELINRYTTNPENVCTLPQFFEIKNALYRTKNENYPPLPKSINDVSIEGKWRMSLSNEEFVLIDQSNPRCIGFGTLESLQNLCTADHLFLDGTFKSCPAPFAQLYSIHTESSVLRSTIPVLYSLLPNKTKLTYTSFFNEVRNVALKNDFVLNPKFITIDFEQGAISALNQVFPSATVKGCSFHYNQCLFKKIQEFGLQQDYYASSDDDPKSVKAFYQQTGALAFMPMWEIDDFWCQIMDSFDHIPRSQDFFDYCTDTWIDNDSMFPRTLWNYYGFDGARTNNGVEGWHHRLNANISSTNPNLYVVIEELKNDYAFNAASVKQVEQQENKNPRKKKFLLRNRRIRDLMNRHKNGSLSVHDYFMKISKTIGRKKKIVPVSGS